MTTMSESMDNLPLPGGRSSGRRKPDIVPALVVNRWRTI